MRPRFWVAMAAGAAVGGGAVLGFPPYVRAELRHKAERYGADVSVEQVMPAVSGVRLRGVSLALRDVPGVRLWFDDVVVGWRDRRPVAMSGGRLVAVGSLEQLAAAVDSWRRGHRGGDGRAGGAWSLSGLSVDWRASADAGAEHLHAEGVDVGRRGDRYLLAAASVAAEIAPLKVSVTGARAAISRGKDGTRLHQLAATALQLDDGADLAPPEPEPAPPDKIEPPRPRTPAKAHSEEGAASDPPRVLAARRLLLSLSAAAGRIDGLLAADADVAVRGARVRVVLRGQRLTLGPGTFQLEREPGALVVALAPDLSGLPPSRVRGRGRDAKEPLTFSAHLPLPGSKDKPLSAELRGGPVWLSLLGLKDGDFGLVHAEKASLESDARVVLSADGQTLTIDGGAKLHQLALQNARLGEGAVEGLELAWRGKAFVRLDGSEISLDDSEIDLGALKLLLSGRYRHAGPAARPLDLDASAVDLSYEIPLTGCQSAFDSLPHALVPKLAGTTMTGSLSLKGHARFDTARLAKAFDVDWDGTLGCRIVQVPAALAVANFKKPFEKIVYTPEGDERTMTFGPGTESWVPYAAIPKFVEAGVQTCEDGRFFRHHGFDKEAIVNSIKDNLAAGYFRRGASTVSMQLAKNLYLSRKKTLSRKLQEAILTIYLEQQLTKQEMLELYFNLIEYGPMIYGIGPAAQHYFHTGASTLSLSQSFYLTSILQQPRKQYFGPNGAVTPERMSYLYKLMKLAHKIHLISDDDLEAGLRETVVFGQPEPAIADKSDDATDPAKAAAEVDGI